jgi:general secretion pathway protein A
MYRHAFGLTESPFSIAPDPRYLFMSDKHREGLAHLLYGLQSDCGFVLLTGEVGTGKTTVCRCLLEQVPAETDVAFILNPKVTVDELLATICDEFALPYPPGGSNKILIDRLNGYLLENHARGRRSVLIIDEAQNLGADLLEQLRLLTNLETNERKLLQILLLGQPELRDKLARPELRQFAQRITARYHLEPLAREEIGAYVAHRLEVAGGRGNLFPDSSLKEIFKLSGGIPRLINVLCDRALLGIYVEGKEKVDLKVLRRAAREVFGNQKIKRALPRGRFAVVAGAAVMILVAVFLWTARPELLPLADGRSENSAAMAVGKAGGGVEVSPLQWPAPAVLPASRQAAFRNLFAEWGLVYAGEWDGDACRFAVSQGLRCLEQKGGWESLLRLNLPAVLLIEDDHGHQFFAALTGIDRETAVLKTGEQTQRVAIGELGAFWQGEFTLLWRPPSFYRSAIQLGAKEQLVAWLADRLAQLTGEASPPGADTFDEQLADRVKAFQLSAGLSPDGIVGPQTLIHLNAAAGVPVPRLVPGEGGI